MSCKHDSMDNLPFHSQRHCRDCGMSETEIALEAKLEAAESALAEERARRETRPVLYWREKAERAEADLKQNIATKCEHYDRMTRELDEAITAKEQAEVQCAAIADAYVKMKGDFQHDAYCKLNDSPPGDKCTCGVWEMVKAIEYADAASALLAELQRYREALEVLSKLGNGDSPGNSDGNRIAQAALATPEPTP